MKVCSWHCKCEYERIYKSYGSKARDAYYLYGLDRVMTQKKLSDHDVAKMLAKAKGLKNVDTRAVTDWRTLVKKAQNRTINQLAELLETDPTELTKV